MLHGNGVDEGLLDKLFELGGELGPVAGDLLAEEDGGELADVGGFGSAHVLDERGNNLGVLSETLNLVFGLAAGIVVGHEELNQQEFKRLRHRILSLLLLLPPRLLLLQPLPPLRVLAFFTLLHSLAFSSKRKLLYYVCCTRVFDPLLNY